MYKPIKKEKISARIADQIKSLITQGKLKPGEFLPPERQLMKLLKVSRPSLREGLKSLTGMGLLEVTAGNRTMVKSLAAGKIFSSLEHILKDDIRNVFELIEVRKALETWNAYFAAKRATSDDIALLEGLVESMRKTIEEHGVALEEQDADLHLAIASATHNTIQAHLMFTIHDTLREFIDRYYSSLRDDKNIFDQHTRIVEAIKNRAPDLARREIFRHLEYVESRVKGLIQLERGAREGQFLETLGASRDGI